MTLGIGTCLHPHATSIECTSQRWLQKQHQHLFLQIFNTYYQSCSQRWNMAGVLVFKHQTWIKIWQLAHDASGGECSDFRKHYERHKQSNQQKSSSSTRCPMKSSSRNSSSSSKNSQVSSPPVKLPPLRYVYFRFSNTHTWRYMHACIG